MGGPRVILHVDMDAFFAAVEVLDDPRLAGRPLIVGGAGPRGVVASCSYEARAFGVSSAMPSARARRLCPDAVFVPGRHDRYQAESRRMHAVLSSFTPLVEGIGLDEAFLDVTGARRLFGDGPAVAEAVRRGIAADLHLSASVGVATSKLIAKLASKAAKPRPAGRGPEGRGCNGLGPAPGLGVKVVAPGQELAFLHPLPVQALWGVGPATLRRLDRFGVRSVGDLAALPPATLIGALGPAVGAELHRLAWARDQHPVEPGRVAKSIGHEETYAVDHDQPDLLRREAARLADGVGSRLRAASLAGRTVTLKVRFGDFRTITRSRTAPRPVDTGTEISAIAAELLAAVDVTGGVRLLGVSVSNLAPPADRQLSLGGAHDSAERVTGAVDAVRGRFGAAAVGPGALLGRSGVRPKTQGDQQWGPGAPAR